MLVHRMSAVDAISIHYHLRSSFNQFFKKDNASALFMSTCSHFHTQIPELSALNQIELEVLEFGRFVNTDRDIGNDCCA